MYFAPRQDNGDGYIGFQKNDKSFLKISNF